MNRRVRLKARLYVAAFSLAVLCVAVLVEKIGTAPLRSSQTRLESLSSQWLPSTLALHELRANLAELRAYELAQVAHSDDQAAVADYDTRIAAKRQGVRQALASYQATQTASEQQLQLSAQVKHKLDAYLELHDQIAQAVHAGDKATADDLSIRLAQPLRRDLFADIVTLTDKVYAARPQSRLAQR